MSEALRDLLDSYDNVVERIVDFCSTPKTTREIAQKFGIVEDVIKVVFRELVKCGEFEIKGEDKDGQDVFRTT